MRTSTKIFSLLFTSFTLVACSGGDDDTITPPGTPQPRNVDPIPGGGTSGGTIDGVLTVFVQDEAKVAIEGATVLVVYGGENLTLKTDAEGRVDFNKEGLDTTLSLHVFMDGFEFNSSYGFDASVVTIALSDGLDDVPAMPMIGTFTGTVSGWGQLSANSSTTARVAVVDALGKDVDAQTQKPRPGTVTPGDPDGSEYNVVINGEDPFPMWTNYSLEADTRAERLIVSGGIFDLNSGAITFERIGTIGGASVAAGQTAAEQNLTMTHALDQTMSVTTNSLPMLANRQAVFALTWGGTTDVLFGLSAKSFPGASESALAPALTGDFAGAKYTIGVQASSTEMVGGGPAQSSFAIRTGDALAVTFEKILAPPAAPTVTGRAISTMPTAGATLHIIEIRDDSTSKSNWSVVMIGNVGNVELPAVPDGIADPLAGTKIIRFDAIDAGNIDPNNASFDAIEDSVVSIGGTRAEATF